MQGKEFIVFLSLFYFYVIIHSMTTWIVVVGWISKGVLVLLVGLSVWSIAIMFDRIRLFRQLDREDQAEDAVRLIRVKNWQELARWAAEHKGLRSGSIRAAMEAKSNEPEIIDRSVRSFITVERSTLESGLTTLATLGSNAPFIGLFGTVLGIIQAFGVLGNSQYSSTAVMQGIAEALVATAVGLFVAIPAVIAYNVFSRKLRVLLTECDSLRDFYISRINEDTGPLRDKG